MRAFKYLLLLISMAMYSCIHCQYGYMGKRLTVKAGVSFYTCAVYNIYGSYNEPRPGLYLFESSKAVRRVLFAQHLDLGFIVSRQWEINAQATIRSINYVATRHSSYYYSYKPQFEEIPVLETSVDLCARKYIRGANAPIGGYFIFGLGKSTAKSSIREDSLRFSNNSFNRPDLTIPTYNSSWTAIRINYGMGIKKTINNKYFYELEGMLMIPVLDRKSGYAVINATPMTESITYMNETIQRQFSAYQNFYAKIGVGVFLGKTNRMTKSV